MPTPVGHSLAGIGLFLTSRRESSGFAIACIAAATSADLDFALNFITGENWHHYFTHSIGFALLFGLAVYLLARRRSRDEPGRDALWLLLAYGSHLLLDLFSEDNLAPYGLELFWPVSDGFVIAPVSLFDNILRGTVARLFSLHNWMAVGREVLILTPLVLLAFWRSRALARGRRQG